MLCATVVLLTELVVCAAEDNHKQFSAVSVAGTVASKLKSAVFSFARSWLGGGGGTGASNNSSSAQQADLSAYDSPHAGQAGKGQRLSPYCAFGVAHCG